MPLPMFEKGRGKGKQGLQGRILAYPSFPKERNGTVCFLDRWPKTKCKVNFDTLFHAVPSVLLSMVASKTTYFIGSEWPLKNF